MDAQQVTFGRHLASNEKSVRDKTMVSLKTFLKRMNKATEMDLLKIWKGLFYCMWMSDKTPVQQELAQNMSELVHCFKAGDRDLVMRFLRAFFQTMRREWLGIDKFRLDKYLSLLRKQLHEVFLYLRQAGWATPLVEAWADVLYEEVVDSKPNGLRCHVVDCYLSELRRAAGSEVSDATFQLLLEPYYRFVALGKDGIAFTRVHDQLFKPLSTGEVPVGQVQQQQEKDEQQDGEGIEATGFRNVSLVSVADRMHASAALPSTMPKHRRMIYALHGRCQKVMRRASGATAAATYELDVDVIPFRGADVAGAAAAAAAATAARTSPAAAAPSAKDAATKKRKLAEAVEEKETSKQEEEEEEEEEEDEEEQKKKEAAQDEQMKDVEEEEEEEEEEEAAPVVAQESSKVQKGAKKQKTVPAVAKQTEAKAAAAVAAAAAAAKQAEDRRVVFDLKANKSCGYVKSIRNLKKSPLEPAAKRVAPAQGALRQGEAAKYSPSKPTTSGGSKKSRKAGKGKKQRRSSSTTATTGRAGAGSVASTTAAVPNAAATKAAPVKFSRATRADFAGKRKQDSPFKEHRAQASDFFFKQTTTPSAAN